jgi:hypothetical protein
MTNYKVVIQADLLKEIIPIPSEFEHKEVEVNISLHQKKKFNPREYRGIGNETKEKIDLKIASLRNEWNSYSE